MLRFVIFYGLLLSISIVHGQLKEKRNKLLQQLIPEPNNINDLNNQLIISSPKVKIIVHGLENEFKFFNDYLNHEYNFKIQPTTNGKTVFLFQIDTLLKSSKQEAYTLYIANDSIIIVGKSKTGVFRGIQTLIQLFPFEKKSFNIFYLPCVYIVDEPRFTYRGNHLDVARHFFPIDYLKKYIDWLAWYKFNYFHWHLTDDQGWRIQIKALPKLQTIAAYRDEIVVTNHDSIRYGGFYTQEEIKDLVQYATERNITIIPEIEMPGHALAALSAYPELGCKGISYKAATTWGVFDDVFCAGNEETYIFLEKVLNEVCELFPAKYIHIGGDECTKIQWQSCEKCQAKIKNEYLKNESELQAYLIKRIQQYLRNKGKTIIGWDEIAETNLTSDAIIMSWRGEASGRQGATAGHQVILSPNNYWYLDYAQKHDEDSLVIGGYLPLERVYEYKVMPNKLSPEQQQLIMGGQANVWTEYISNSSKLEYMIFPRLAAVSECLWTYPNKKNYAYFLSKILLQLKAYQTSNTNYSKAILGIHYNFSKKKDSFFLNMQTLLHNGKYILKTNNNPLPTIYQNKFLNLPILNTGKYNIVLTDDKNQKIDELNFNFIYNDAFAKNIIWVKGASYPYTGSGKYGLVDGLIAKTNKINDRQWIGFKTDAIFYIDLDTIKNIQVIKAHFKELPSSNIFAPKDFFVETSLDGNIFEFQPLEIISEQKGDFSKNDWWQLFVNTQARYLKITFKNNGNKSEDETPNNNNHTWIFVDEFSIN